jgi:hypothetical protein
MSLDQLKDQVAHLKFQEQRELIAYLVAIQTGRDEQFQQSLAEKIDDKDPARWMELDEVRKRLAD